MTNNTLVEQTKNALITGASKGLGLELAGFLALQGYNLIITARSAEQLETAAAQLRDIAPAITAIAGDIADLDHRQRLIAAAQQFGRLDILVNNASTLGPLPMPSTADYLLDALRRVFEVDPGRAEHRVGHGA